MCTLIGQDRITRIREGHGNTVPTTVSTRTGVPVSVWSVLGQKGFSFRCKVASSGQVCLDDDLDETTAVPRGGSCVSRSTLPQEDSRCSG